MTIPWSFAENIFYLRDQQTEISGIFSTPLSSNSSRDSAFTPSLMNMAHEVGLHEFRQTDRLNNEKEVVIQRQIAKSGQCQCRARGFCEECPLRGFSARKKYTSEYCRGCGTSDHKGGTFWICEGCKDHHIKHICKEV